VRCGHRQGRGPRPHVKVLQRPLGLPGHDQRNEPTVDNVSGYLLWYEIIRRPVCEAVEAPVCEAVEAEAAAPERSAGLRVAKPMQVVVPVIRTCGERDADGSGEHPPWQMLRDTFGAVCKVEGYDGNEVRYAVYNLAHPSKLIEQHHSQSWSEKGNGAAARG
jgi:hypothetical protein